MKKENKAKKGVDAIRLLTYNLFNQEAQMRYLLLTKWIQEINKEMEKAKQEVNYAKLLELRKLREELVKLRDGPS